MLLRSKNLNGRWTLLIALTVIAAIAVGFYAFSSYIASLSMGFDNDEYAHAAAAHDLYILSERGEWGQFSKRVKEEVFYPPFNSLVLAAGFHLVPPSPASARLLCFTLYILALLIVSCTVFLFIKQAQGSSEKGLIAALFALLLGASCPTAIFNSTLVMLEAVGMLLATFMMMILLVVNRKLSSHYGVVAALSVGILLTLLLFTKYTFPVFFVPGLVFASLLSAIDSWKDLRIRFKWLCLAAIIPIAASVTWIFSTNWEIIRNFLFDYPARGYVIGVKTLFYYPIRFFTEYCYSTFLATIALILVIVGTAKYWRTSFAVRFSAWSLIITCLFMGVVSERAPRHILVAIPLVWFLAGVGWYQLVTFLERRGLPVKTGATFLLIMTLSISWSFYNEQQWVKRQVVRYMEYRPGVDAITATLNERINPYHPFVIFGGELIPLPYYLDWLLSIRSRKTIDEIDELRYYPPEDDTLITSKRTLKELTNTLSKIINEKSAKTLIFLSQNSTQSLTAFNVVNELLCPEILCDKGEVYGLKYISVAPEDIKKQKESQE